MSKRVKVSSRIFLWSAVSIAVAACGQRDKLEPEPEPEVVPTATPTSIIRPDIEETPVLPLEPLEMTVPFAEGGSELSDNALEKLREIRDSAQMEAGGAIVLRGHTDSEGHDEANLRASRKRAEVVRDWLVENGVAEDRITIVALGEQRPAEPNANLDGTPNEEGRAANRRVDVSIAVPEPTPAGTEEPNVEPEQELVGGAAAADAEGE